ncbi:hypothetical protein C8Q74DRAFT_1192151 [Fomes fomentarius]|nr:hypothetical protein C8Q74DRAFT_1192151 [Fomes fomentarius]
MAPTRTFTRRRPLDSSQTSSSSSGSEKTRNTAFWEGDQYLLETAESNDPKRPGRRLTEAAGKAQRKRWQRLMANRPPTKIISPKLLPRKGKKPPLLYYGWPFKVNDMMLYAKRHSLSYKPSEKTRAILDFDEVFDFGSLTEEQINDPQLVRALQCVATSLVQNDLIKKTGAQLEIGRPFSLEWESILVLWTNYNIEERYGPLDDLGTFETVVKTLHKAMNEGRNRDERTKLRWWWSWNNDVVR